jgi:hypothetical protein
MLISLVNHTNGKVKDEDVQTAIRAINRQLLFDFGPFWHTRAEMRLEGPAGEKPSKVKLAELRGDAVIYLWDSVDVDDAIGYHESNARGIPFGFVFTELSKQLDEPWSVTLSHEALELVGDPEVNLLVAGPHPGNPDQEVFHWYEMCDAVQNESYKIDGVVVSNFLLPLYFTPDPEVGGRNDFLGRKYKGTTLPSFGINPGGYVGFYNPESGEHETFSLKADKTAEKRLALKAKAAITRRSLRYRRNHATTTDTGRSAVATRAAPGDAAETTARVQRAVQQIASQRTRSST